MSREINRYPPLRFNYADRPPPAGIEHHDRIQQFSIDAAALAGELRKSIRGEVRFDDGARALYATDASNYRQVPIGVVVPSDAADVVATVALARKYGAPILGRGAGTSLAGQCCNVAVVLDMSKYMHHIVELNPAQRYARVEPGLVLDDLRREAEKHTLTFGPDPATHAQCTLGGMIGNNSCGVHSIMSGKTVDNIEELEILTYDGHRMRVGATSDAELEAIIAAGGRKGEIYAGLRSLRDRYSDLVRQRFPRIRRRVSGYNLDELLPENGFNVARALVGSESTCVVVLEAKARLVYSPPVRALAVIGYPTVYEAADDVPRVLDFGPIGLEGFDDLLVRDMKHKQMHPAGIAMLPPGGGWLLVEFGGESLEEAVAKAQQLLSSRNLPSRLFDDARDQRMVWAVRESALGATGHVPGRPLMWEGWEDAAVAPAKLGGYLRDLRKLLDRYEYGGDLYGHFGDGCVHTRTNFDLTSTEGIAKFRSFIDEAADLVASYGGSFSGEHGDGQARAALLGKMFGPELMEAFRQFKALWDPEWKMNPGKVIEPYQPEENLRLGAGYAPWSPDTHFSFPEDHGRMDHAVLRCVGVGRCRRLDGGTMCPSYQVTREEEHSTRGRARLLFEMFQGEAIAANWNNEVVKESLDLCLACKGCKGDCPTGVDMATYKAEFLSHYYESHRRPMAAYTMGLIYWWAGLASKMPRLANLLMRAPFANRLAGVARERTMPRFAPRTFRDLWKRRSPRGASGRKRVVLWADTFNNHFLPDTALAAVEVLERAGYEVTIPSKRVCCGRPLYDWGFVARAKKLLAETMDVLEADLLAGVPVIGLEPSCVAVFRDELPNLFPDDPRAKQLTALAMTLSEFIASEGSAFELPTLKRKAIVQAHCHHKAIMRFDPEEALLRKLGLDLTHPDSGCCGMAGAFGFEQKNYELSMKVGERVILPMVRDAGEDTLVIANGFSCREQLEQGTGKKTLHFAEVLKLAWDRSSEDSKP